MHVRITLNQIGYQCTNAQFFSSEVNLKISVKNISFNEANVKSSTPRCVNGPISVGVLSKKSAIVVVFSNPLVRSLSMLDHQNIPHSKRVKGVVTDNRGNIISPRLRVRPRQRATLEGATHCASPSAWHQQRAPVAWPPASSLSHKVPDVKQCQS